MLSKRTQNQIIKNHQVDSIESNFNKSIKYLEKNKIPFEEAIGIIIEKQKSLIGLPILLIKENLITNYQYIFNGVSINLLIEAYKKDYIIDIQKNFKLNNTNYFFITNILLLIKDKNLLLEILNENKNVFFKDITEQINGYTYNFINYLSFLYHIDNKNMIENIKELFEMILFNIEWSKKEINVILYETNEDNNRSLIEDIVNDYNIKTFKKIVKKYGFDYEKSVPNKYSYYYIPIIPFLFLIDERFDYSNKNKINKLEISKQFLDLFIELKVNLFPKEMLSQTKSNDIEMNKMFGDKSCKGTISRGYYTTSKEIKEAIDDNKDNSSKTKTIELIKYYFENSNTLEIDNSFWSLTLVSNKELNSILLEFKKKNGKKWTYEEVRNTLKNAIYSNKPENLHDFLKDNKENLELLHKKNKYSNTMLLDILQESERDIKKEKLLELCKILLDYGYRINNHYGKDDFYEFFMFKNIGIQNELKKLCKEYPNNYKEMIVFNIEKPYKILESFNQIEETTKEFLRVLEKLGFENIKQIYFDEIIKKEIIYFIPNLNKFISLNIDLLNGVELKKEDIKFI